MSAIRKLYDADDTEVRTIEDAPEVPRWIDQDLSLVHRCCGHARGLRVGRVYARRDLSPGAKDHGRPRGRSLGVPRGFNGWDWETVCASCNSGEWITRRVAVDA